MVPEEALQDLADDEYYYHEIVGLDVVDNATGKTLGKVAEIMELPANDVCWRAHPAAKTPTMFGS